MLVTDAAQHLGGAVDDRLHQPIEHRFRLMAAAAGLGDAVEEDVEGTGARHSAPSPARLLGEDKGDVG